ncbi:MAG: winged helix-turn-helix domain-containing protein [Tannerellaceae bacterium]|jgi:DNA-binding response OmpR family regulator|nr:winged helix-turn-helix domain-containing protein [Tannerellaceae bacterium]
MAKKTSANTSLYPIGSYLFDPGKCLLKWKDESIELTIRESKILEMLYERKKTVVKREDILRRFWGTSDFYTSRSLDVFVSKLRKYLKKDPSIQLQTVRGEGVKMIF